MRNVKLDRWGRTRTTPEVRLRRRIASNGPLIDTRRCSNVVNKGARWGARRSSGGWGRLLGAWRAATWISHRADGARRHSDVSRDVRRRIRAGGGERGERRGGAGARDPDARESRAGAGRCSPAQHARCDRDERAPPHRCRARTTAGTPHSASARGESAAHIRAFGPGSGQPASRGLGCHPSARAPRAGCSRRARPARGGGERPVDRASLRTSAQVLPPIVASADAYVQSDLAGTNFGTAATLNNVFGTPESLAFLRFNVSGVSGTIRRRRSGSSRRRVAARATRCAAWRTRRGARPG